MGAYVLLLLLVWAFSAVCEDSLSITCDDVTGHVGKELTLTCRVSDPSDTCNIKNYRFINKDEDTTFCREEFTSVYCKQLIIFSCPYTANEVMTSSFKFFIQTTNGPRSADFTVTIPDAVKEDKRGEPETAEEPSVPTDNTALIASITSCSIIIVITVIYVVAFTLKKKNSTDIQRDYNLVEHTSTTDVTSTTTTTTTTTVNVQIENASKNNTTVSESTTN